MPTKYLITCMLLVPFGLFGQDTLQLSTAQLAKPIGNLAETFVDSSGAYTPETILQIKRGSFRRFPKKVSSFLADYNNVWVRVALKNQTSENSLFLYIDYANIPKIEAYKMVGGKLQVIKVIGNRYPFYTRKANGTGFVVPLATPAGSSSTYYVHFTSIHPLQLPLSIYDENGLSEALQKETLIIGLYAGLIVSILLYNFFLFFSTKDSSYFYYVLYLLALLLAQLTFSGWAFKLFWPNYPQLNAYAVIITSTLPGVTALVFGLSFLRVNNFSKILVWLFYALMVLYICPLLAVFFNKLSFFYSLLTYNGLIGGVLLIITSGYIAWGRGYRPAYYYFFAWFVFAVGRQVLSLRNLDVLPYNNFTSYILYIGSAIEAIMLSLALADRINIYKKEKEQSQQEALDISKENERLVRDQNITLEKMVLVRTEELSEALVSLKDAQAQLVDAEKMASLGQLTAGIAHEINNPINFVKSNINPLRLDIKDVFDVFKQYNTLHGLNGDATVYKKQLQQIAQFQQDVDIEFIKDEIYQLIKGIEDGAERTAEIVRGLRTFSRLDESELKTVNIHDGIESTIVLIRNNIPFYVQVIKDFKAKGEVECYPGKLNQVFMNIINNGLQAINAKAVKDSIEAITIATKDVDGNHVEISIKDTGIGMTEEVKHRVFEPFFTTKDVGEGTGLGMAIVFKIIEKHHGKIKITSSPGNGAEFILTLPHSQPITY